jgi:hypothetical protein
MRCEPMTISLEEELDRPTVRRSRPTEPAQESRWRGEDEAPVANTENPHRHAHDSKRAHLRSIVASAIPVASRRKRRHPSVGGPEALWKVASEESFQVHLRRERRCRTASSTSRTSACSPPGRWTTEGSQPTLVVELCQRSHRGLCNRGLRDSGAVRNGDHLLPQGSWPRLRSGVFDGVRWCGCLRLADWVVAVFRHRRVVVCPGREPLAAPKVADLRACDMTVEGASDFGSRISSSTEQPTKKACATPLLQTRLMLSTPRRGVRNYHLRGLFGRELLTWSPSGQVNRRLVA